MPSLGTWLVRAVSSTVTGMAGRARRVLRVLTEGGVVVCERCEVADRTFARMRGLLGRKGLEPGGGMLLTPEPSVHMFFMRFPIDVVFLDRENRVVGVRHELRPWRVAGARGAYATLELPAGTAAATGIEEGSLLTLEDVDA